MFGPRYFGERYYGPRYFGTGGSGSGDIPGQEGASAASDRNARMSGVLSMALRGARMIAFLLTGAL